MAAEPLGGRIRQQTESILAVSNKGRQAFLGEELPGGLGHEASGAGVNCTTAS